MTNDNKSLIDDAVLMFAMGDEIKSEELLLKVLESDPANIDALRAVSEVSLSLGKIDQAELHCRQAVKQDPDDLTSIVSLARILVKKGDKEGAEEASARATHFLFQIHLIGHCFKHVIITCADTVRFSSKYQSERKKMEIRSILLWIDIASILSSEP